MDTALLVATVLCASTNAFIVIAKVVRAPFVLRNVVDVGLEPRVVPALAAIEGLGTVGVLAGLLGATSLGLAAAAGLVGFFLVAIMAHVRTRSLKGLPFPIFFLITGLGAFAYFW